jgi:hypothetical protein
MMPGPINSIFAAVTARLASLADYSDAADWCSVGAVDNPAANVPPRIVWVPVSESFGPAIGQGGDGVKNPRPIGTRQSSIECHLWAAAEVQSGQPDQIALDMDACEALLNAFAWALYSRLHGSPAALLVGTGRWTRGNVLGQNLTLGIGYILPFTVNIPITRPPEATARIARIRATVSAPTDPASTIVIP